MSGRSVVPREDGVTGVPAPTLSDRTSFQAVACFPLPGTWRFEPSPYRGRPYTSWPGTVVRVPRPCVSPKTPRTRPRTLSIVTVEPEHHGSESPSSEDRALSRPGSTWGPSHVRVSSPPLDPGVRLGWESPFPDVDCGTQDPDEDHRTPRPPVAVRPFPAGRESSCRGTPSLSPRGRRVGPGRGPGEKGVWPCPGSGGWGRVTGSVRAPSRTDRTRPRRAYTGRPSPTGSRPTSPCPPSAPSRTPAAGGRASCSTRRRRRTGGPPRV